MSGPGAPLVAVAPGVLVATSAFWATNTTVITAADGSALLIDPGVLPDELAALPAQLAGARLVVVAGACTHAHWDHVLWPAGLDEVERYASSTTIELLARHRPELIDQPLEDEAGARNLRWAPLRLGLTALADGHTVPWDGPATTALIGAAHVAGHTSLLVEGAGVLVAGDLLSDVDVPFPAFEPTGVVDDPVAGYRAALDRLEEVLGTGAVGLVIPGHGTPTDLAGARRRLDADRRYLDLLVAVTQAPATVDEARRRADAVDDPRLAGTAVRHAHRESVAALLTAGRTRGTPAVRPAGPGR